MTTGQYLLASGIAAPTEQDTLDRLDEFMAGAIGWSRLAVVSDTAGDNDRVWFSRGETGEYAPMFVRARAASDAIYFSGYTNWIVGVSGTDVLEDQTELRIPNDCSGGYDEYCFVGNKDAVFVAVRRYSDGANYLGGWGYWDTYYTATQDPYPLWVMGQNAAVDTFSNTRRVRSYGFDPDGFLHASSTVSGGAVGFISEDLSVLTALGTPNPRDGRHIMLKAPFYREVSAVDGAIGGMVSHEVRGEVPGVYSFYGSNFTAFDRVTASGISVGDESGPVVTTGDFLVVRSSEANTAVLGPVTDYAPAPLAVPNLELWLTAGAVQRVGGSDSGGLVSACIDISGEGHEATQAVSAYRPVPLASGIATNSRPIIVFDDAAYVTGSLNVVNDYTIFVVSGYDENTGFQPVLSVRGDVGGSDTLYSVEYNTSISGVEARFSSGAGNTNVERYSGLAPNTLCIVSAVASGTSTVLYVDGDSAGSSTISGTKGSVSGSTLLAYGVGTSLDASGNPTATRFSGHVAEVVVYTRDLTQEEHQSVVSYLGTKYGIAVTGG